MNITLVLLMSGVISTIALILLLAVFGKLIVIQLQRWRLAKAGYVEVEHISETNVRRYFILKPKANKFDVNEGFYFYIPEALTKGGEVLKKYDEAFLFPEEVSPEYKDLLNAKKSMYQKKIEAERVQMREFAEVIKSLSFKNEALSWKFGMPIITYYGDNPEPLVFRERKKTFGSGVIKDAYLRLLMTQRFKDFQLFMLVGLIAIVVIAVANAGQFYIVQGVARDLGTCQNTLNVSVSALDKCINANIPIFQQNSTLIIG